LKERECNATLLREREKVKHARIYCETEKKRDMLGFFERERLRETERKRC